MAKRVHGRHYAQAIFSIALERKELDRWQSDLNQLARLVGGASLAAFLQSPKVPFALKTRLLSERLPDMNPMALNLVCLLATKGRLRIMSDIAAEYQRLLDSHRGVQRAKVKTAIPLSDADRERLSQQLSNMTGKKVLVEAEVDSTIVGGIVARIDDKLLDGSTQSKLTALKKELARGGA